MKKVFRIEVDCANCAALMERAAAEVEGVRSVSVSYMALKMHVEFEEGADASRVMREVKKRCRKIEPDCEIYF